MRAAVSDKNVAVVALGTSATAAIAPAERFLLAGNGPASQPPNPSTGSVRRMGLVKGDQIADWDSPSNEFIAPCVRATAIWAASSIAEGNGATMV